MLVSNSRSMSGAPRLVRVFTPSFADASNTNAQNLTVKEVVARLDPEHFHVTMLHLGEGDPRIVGRRNTTLWRWRKHGNSAGILLRLLASIPDVYFFPREGPLEVGFYRLRRAMRWKTGVVTYMVSGGLDRAGLRPGQLRNLREAHSVYGNCSYLTRLLSERCGFNAETIYDGVDRRYYFPRGWQQENQQEGLTALFAGSFRAYKRVDWVVKQAARSPHIKFRLAGCGETEEHCQRLASDLQCSNVRFLGHLSQSDLGNEMRGADLFLFPSELEGHPQVLLQAAACGLPVLAMDSYRPDAVVDGKTGFLAADEQDFEQKFDLLAGDPTLRARMSKASIEHSAQFDWGRVTAQWAQAFNRAAGERA